MFFKTMPNLVYKTGNKAVNVKDIFKRVALRKFARNKAALEAYYIKDGETPEVLAKLLYNNVYYHWIILVVNDIVNPYEEWPLTENELNEFVTDKYGVGNEYNDHHYIINETVRKGIIDSNIGEDYVSVRDENAEYFIEQTETIVDYDSAKIASGEYQAVTNYDYELKLNDEKRQIFILLPKYVNEFVTQYNKLMGR
jgi:hypothetical protein